MAITHALSTEHFARRLCTYVIVLLIIFYKTEQAIRQILYLTYTAHADKRATGNKELNFRGIRYLITVD